MEEQKLQEVAQAVLARIFVELEASGRHVHVTKQQAQALFGHGLTPKRPLSQPGQFLANERLTVIGPKGTFENVAVLGPERKEAQVEISLTDGKSLGIHPPIRQSGDVKGSPGVILVDDIGTVALQQGVIAAQRHIHMTPEAAARFGIAGLLGALLGLYYDLPDLECYDLSQIFIDERYQGRGYGRTATKLILDAMKQDGKYSKVDLCYIEGNNAAKKLYESIGFVEIDRDEDEIILELML